MVNYNLLENGVVVRTLKNQDCFSGLRYSNVNFDEVKYFCPINIETEIKSWFLENARNLIDFKIISQTKSRITFSVSGGDYIKTLSVLTLLRYLDKNEDAEYDLAYDLLRSAYQLREHSSFLNVLFAAHFLWGGPSGYGHTIAATGNTYHYSSFKYYLPRQENLKDNNKAGSVHSFFGNKEISVEVKNELVQLFKDNVLEGFKELDKMLK